MMASTRKQRWRAEANQRIRQILAVRRAGATARPAPAAPADPAVVPR